MNGDTLGVSSLLTTAVFMVKPPLDAVLVAGVPNLKPPLGGSAVLALVVVARLNGLGLLESVETAANLKPPDVVNPETLKENVLRLVSTQRLFVIS